MRKTKFTGGEFYHIYNRGVDKRRIFLNVVDLERFFLSMRAFNTVEPIGSVYENSFDLKFGRRTSKKEKKLVNFVAYCLNPNHFHFILEQLTENGISEFIKRLSGGYAKYFNERHKRSGALFQGRFKSIHINSNEYLLLLSAYVNLNARVHGINQFGRPTSKLTKSSFEEYINTDRHSKFCNKDVVLGQFRSAREYKEFAEDSVQETIRRRNLDRLPTELSLE